MSAVFGALSCGLVGLIVSHAGRLLYSRGTTRVDLSVVSGISASLILGLSSTLWSQAVITETHTLTLFFIILFHVVALWWLKLPTIKRGVVLASIFGAGMGQSHFLIFLVPTLIQSLSLISWRVIRDFSLAVLGLIILPCFFLKADLPVGAKVVSVAVCIALATYVPRSLSHYWAQAPLSVLAIFAGLGLYFIYLPLASEGNAPMQFGYARTWVGFWHVFLRGQYEKPCPINVFEYSGLLRLGQALRWYGETLIRQFSPSFLFVGYVGVVTGLCAPAHRAFPSRLCAISLFAFTVLVLIGINPRGTIQDTFIQRTRLIPSYAIVAVFIGIGLCGVLSWLTRDRPLVNETAR